MSRAIAPDGAPGLPMNEARAGLRPAGGYPTIAEQCAAALEACRLGVLYDDMLREYAGPISQCGALLAGDRPNIDAAYDAWMIAARKAVGAPVLGLPSGLDWGDDA